MNQNRDNGSDFMGTGMEAHLVLDYERSNPELQEQQASINHQQAMPDTCL